MTDYAELRLRIDRGISPGTYRIVATGPAGEALGRFRLPFSNMELENFVLKVGRTRRGTRRIESPEMELAKTFGAKLFGALFEGDVREIYRSSFADARTAGQGLRLTFSLTGAPELLQIPWEYLYDHPSFLSISTWTPIVRYLDLPKPRRPLQVALPLRILGMVSAPIDADPIDAVQEKAKLTTALAPLSASGAVVVDWVSEPSLLALQRQLRRAAYHVFHFIGHGGYDHDADDGVLLFEDERHLSRRVSGVQLGTILHDEVSMRLAVLNACEGARSSLEDPFSGVATSLIEREIPAVIGMQFEITDRAAIVFASEFYSALADGLAVDSSIAEARKAIYADQNDLEWATPVLFMRVQDGRLFDIEAHAPIRTPVPEPQPDAPPDTGPSVEEGDADGQPEAEDGRRGEADGARDREVAAEAAAARVREADPAAIANSPRSIAAARNAVPHVDVPADLVGAGWRGAVGGVLMIAIGAAAELSQNAWKLGDPSALANFLSPLVPLAAVTMIAMVLANVLIEGIVPAVRIPGGSAYAVVRNNRWAAAALEGAVIGSIVFLIVAGLFFSEDLQLGAVNPVVLLFLGASSFVLAEAVIGMRRRRRPGDDA